MKFSLKKTIIAGVVTASLIAASLVAAIPAFASNPSSFTLQSETVTNGQTFNVTLSVSTTAAASGGKAYVIFDATKLTCNSATYNKTTPYFGAGEFDVAGKIDNTAGTIDALTSTNGGSPNPAVTSTGVWVTLNFTAKAAANNSITTIAFATPTTPNCFLANSVPAAMPTDLNNGIIVVGTLPLPDLTVSNVSTTLASGGTDQTNDPAKYTVTFKVNNSGNLDVTPAFNTSLVINGTATQNFNTTTTLAQGTSETFTSTPITLTGNTDNFVITADTANTVVESNEANNIANGSFTYGYASNNNTNVNGTLSTSATPLKFTQPSDVNFGPLTIGDNNAWPSMNVVTNQSWTVTIKDGTGNNGFMTKYDGTIYYPAVHLTNALQLIASGGTLTAPAANAPIVTLSNTYQQLANGIPAGQATDGISGETRTVNFYQKVVGSDAALSSTYSYHSVVSFTCTPSF